MLAHIFPHRCVSAARSRLLVFRSPRVSDVFCVARNRFQIRVMSCYVMRQAEWRQLFRVPDQDVRPVGGRGVLGHVHADVL